MRRNIGIVALIGLVLVSVFARLTLAWQWDYALLFQDADSLPIEQAAVKTALLPEMVVAFLAGGLLSLASSALQQIVHNNLASDSTLAVGSGAQLALMMAIIFFPNAELFSSFWLAFLGALGAMGLVIFIASRHKLNPLTVILAGLIVNILFGAIAALLVVFYFDFLFGVMVWGSGSLIQDGWATSGYFALVSLAILVVFAGLHKPLMLLSLDDEQAQRLGVPVKLLRLLVLMIATGITAVVVSKIGVIGFIGLAGASCAPLLGARHFYSRLLWSFVAGGLLLLLTDNLIGLIGQFTETLLPVGAFTAALGAPLLIYLVLKNRKKNIENDRLYSVRLVRLASWRKPMLLACATLILVVLLQGFAPTIAGWQIHFDMHLITEHRLPRSLSAIATGAMLAVSGALLQTLTRNPMASPEVLGISSGAAIAVVLAFLLFPTLGSLGFLSVGVLGSLAVLAVMMWLARQLQPAALMLTGVAIGALVSSVMAIIQLSGNPRITSVVSWLSGSTYYANPQSAWILLGLAVCFVGLSLLLVKPLRLLSLGETISAHLGLSIRQVTTMLLFLIALMSAASTLAVGPMSFIGLMTPHLAKSLGAITPEKQLPISALLGAALMLIADWLGRYLIFPYEIGAGVIASILGGFYFLFQLKQQHH